ncbi:MAG: DUF1273 family protein [Clostridia bacterium]|nr:DUF1273 family protein [Clostridia bacterium]
MTKEKICCFTGHRSLYDDKIKLLEILDVLLDNMITQGYTVFRAGGALGFDMLATEAVIKKKENGRDIRLELMLPCPEQAEKWSEEHRARYKRILLQADHKEYIAEKYLRGCMHERNRRLVDGSALCIAYCKRQSGGTAYTCRYAKEKGLTVINLADYLSAKSEK